MKSLSRTKFRALTSWISLQQDWEITWNVHCYTRPIKVQISQVTAGTNIEHDTFG